MVFSSLQGRKVIQITYILLILEAKFGDDPYIYVPKIITLPQSSPMSWCLPRLFHSLYLMQKPHKCIFRES